MNTTQQLSIEQETNRVAKGYQIYNNGLVEHDPDHINPRLYIVKGRYEVEDLTIESDIEPVFECSCPDHQYRHVRCGHIIAVEFYIIGA